MGGQGGYLVFEKVMKMKEIEEGKETTRAAPKWRERRRRRSREQDRVAGNQDDCSDCVREDMWL